jgi:glycosyltransferase involved in cell wall biosynthesis
MPTVLGRKLLQKNSLTVMPMLDDVRSLGSSSENVVGLRTRVAFLTDIPSPYINEVLRALALKVDLTCLFCSDTSTRGMPWQFGQQLGFRYTVVGGVVVRRRDADGIDYYVSPRIFWHLIRVRPSVIISGMFSFPTLYGWLYARLFGAKLFIFSDGTARSERNLSWLQRVARRFLLPRAAGCIAQSVPAAERFKELAPTKPIFVAPHTTNLSPFLEIAAVRNWSARPELRLLTVGRLIQGKGIHHLIRALAQMPSTHRPVHLTVVGSGPEEGPLKALAESYHLTNIKFSGFVDQAQLPAFYADADAFVFPTLGDTFGIAMLEAAASGLALVASNEAGATKDLITNDEMGLVFDPRDESTLATQIALLADNHNLVVSMGRAAHGLARERTAERAADGYLSAIRGTSTAWRPK